MAFSFIAIVNWAAQARGTNSPLAQLITYGLIGFFFVVMVCLFIYCHARKKK